MSGNRGQRFDAMMVEEYVDNQGQGRSKWTKVGAAFTNKDGSIGVQLNAFPINGKVILQIPMTKEEREAKWGDKQSKQADQLGRGSQRGGQQREGQPRQGGFGNYGGRQQPPQQQRREPEPPPDYPGSWDDENEAPPAEFADDEP